MRSEIRRICKDSGITAVYVTHDQKEALSMADRMAVLRAGKIVQIGQPREMYLRPRTRFVADFLGETNFLPATVRGVEGESVVLDSPAGMLRSRVGHDRSADGLTVGRRVTVSIRPEAWHLGGASGSGDVSSVTCRGRLVSTMYLGEVVQRTIALTDDLQVRVLELNPATQRVASGREMAADATVTLNVNADDVVILED
jgi:iron(III) transport system ATP-binding protein